MGRRGSMKGRPGFLFIIFICICVLIFYLSWQMLLSPKFQRNDKSQSLQEGQGFTHMKGYHWSNVDQQRSAGQKQNERQVPFENDPGQNQLHPPFFSASDEGYKDSKDKEQPLLQIDTENRQNNPDSLDSYFNDADTVLSPLARPTKIGEEKKGFFTQAPIDRKAKPTNPLYHEPLNAILDTVKSMERLVHLDFKGAVPKMSYLRKVIPLFQALGATGLLVEYEDMFPYHGILEPLKADNHFSQEQLSEFLQLAKKYNLTVMPLVQTFGHMEFALKSAFPELRESSYTPQVIDMTSNKTYSILSTMISQVLEAHPDATHLHLGCDEVYELGRGASAAMMKEQKLTVNQMFVKHVKKVVELVSYNGDDKVAPVIWDDMLRKMHVQDISESNLPALVQIMVWNYHPNVTEALHINVFEKYEQIFDSIWIASSFKGATGSRQFYTEPMYHLTNHYSWLSIIEDHHKYLKFKGVALTGWQRFDHFATLCDLLPVALPSLAVCLATMENGGFTKEIHGSTSKIMGCSGLLEMTFPILDSKTKKSIVTQDCRFPGSDIYYAMQDFYGYTQIGLQHRLDGWLSDYQISKGFSNPGQLKVLAMDVHRQNSGYSKLEGPLQRHLSAVYTPEDVEEWLEEHLRERKRKNGEILKKVEALLQPKVWPRRPLVAAHTKQQTNNTVLKLGSYIYKDTYNPEKDGQVYTYSPGHIKPLAGQTGLRPEQGANIPGTTFLDRQSDLSARKPAANLVVRRYEQDPNKHVAAYNNVKVKGNIKEQNPYADSFKANKLGKFETYTGERRQDSLLKKPATPDDRSRNYQSGKLDTVSDESGENNLPNILQTAVHENKGNEPDARGLNVAHADVPNQVANDETKKLNALNPQVGNDGNGYKENGSPFVGKSQNKYAFHSPDKEHMGGEIYGVNREESNIKISDKQPWFDNDKERSLHQERDKDVPFGGKKSLSKLLQESEDNRQFPPTEKREDDTSRETYLRLRNANINLNPAAVEDFHDSKMDRYEKKLLDDETE